MGARIRDRLEVQRGGAARGFRATGGERTPPFFLPRYTDEKPLTAAATSARRRSVGARLRGFERPAACGVRPLDRRRCPRLVWAKAEAGGRTRAASAFAGGRSAGDGAHRHSAHQPRPGGVQGVGLWEELVNVLRKDGTSRPRRRLRPPQEGPARREEHPRRLPRPLPRPRTPQEVQVYVYMFGCLSLFLFSCTSKLDRSNV